MKTSTIKVWVYLATILAVIGTVVIMIINPKNGQSETPLKKNIVTTITTVQLTSASKNTITEEKETIEKATEITTESATAPLTENVVVIQTTTTKQTTALEEVEIQITKSEANEVLYSASSFINMGVIYWNSWRWTWYSERVLPGEGLHIPGRHTDSNGYVCDENEYICLSSSSLERGTIIPTPFGKSGKIYDTGCAGDTIDVYVNW